MTIGNLDASNECAQQSGLSISREAMDEPTAARGR